MTLPPVVEALKSVPVTNTGTLASTMVTITVIRHAKLIAVHGAYPMLSRRSASPTTGTLPLHSVGKVIPHHAAMIPLAHGIMSNLRATTSIWAMMIPIAVSMLKDTHPLVSGNTMRLQSLT
jgi:hypothetical protein